MFEIKKLKNGVRVVLESIPFVRSISFGIWVGNGSRHEEKQLNGISHFIEHMLFKGTNTRSAKEIADSMDSIGGQINAYTSKEYTCYHTRTLDTHFDLAIEVMADMFFNSEFEDKEIAKEKNVIMEEIYMYEDSPEELAHDLLSENIWAGNSLGFPILGCEESISSFNNKTFTDFFNEKYNPYNTVVAVAGNFESPEMLEKLEKYFGQWSSVGIRSENCIQKAEYTPNIITKSKDIEQVHICMGFEGIPVGSPDSYTLSVFSAIFGGGFSSRLFQRIREDRGLTYSIYSYASNYFDTGLFTIYAGMSAGQTEEVIKLVVDEINKLAIDKIDEETLIKTKEQLKSNYIIGLESTSNRMSSIGRSVLRLNKIITPDETIEEVDKVTLQSLENLYKKMLDLSKMSCSAVGKIDGINFERILKHE